MKVFIEHKGEKIFCTDREQFIMWTKGELIIRDRDSLKYVDELDCEEAENRLDEGETIGLLMNGELKTTMKLGKKGYIEKFV